MRESILYLYTHHRLVHI